MPVETLIGKVQHYEPSADDGVIRRAFTLAEGAHAGQRRASGESYIEHPLAVAGILAEMEMDVPTIAAAILHDVVEDTSVTAEEVAEQFGARDRQPRRRRHQADPHSLSVEGRRAGREPAQDVHRDGQGHPRDHHQAGRPPAQHADLASLPPDKQQSIARETIEIYAPIAHRLGMWKIKYDLEDLALRYLDPEAYHDIAERVAKKRTEREAAVSSTRRSSCASSSRSSGFEAEVHGRPSTSIRSTRR